MIRPLQLTMLPKIGPAQTTTLQTTTLPGQAGGFDLSSLMELMITMMIVMMMMKMMGGMIKTAAF